jgi:hypothetical protein
VSQARTPCRAGTAPVKIQSQWTRKARSSIERLAGHLLGHGSIGPNPGVLWHLPQPMGITLRLLILTTKS